MRTPYTRLKLAALLLIPLGLGVGYFNSVTSHTKSPEPAGAQSGAPSVCPDSTPFPVVGFDYPQSKATVEGWVARNDERKMREHGWYLWAGLNLRAPDGSPIWRTWCTSTQAFAPPASQLTAEAEKSSSARSIPTGSREIFVNTALTRALSRQASSSSTDSADVPSPT